MRRFTGLRQLVHDAVRVTTDLVEDLNESAAAKTMRVLDAVEPVRKPAHLVNDVRRLAARGVYESIHGVNAIVSKLGDLGETAWAEDAGPRPETIVPMRSDCTREPVWIEDAALGALNGVVGDFLYARDNALDLGMHLRQGDVYLAPEEIQATRIAVLIHGVCVTEWCWCMNAEDSFDDAAANFGTLLERDFGYTPVYVRYNTGRHISENGQMLAELLEGLDCEELILVGHSMGGLVARSACHYAEKAGRRWPSALTHVACLGTPHQGAPLEKAGNVITSVLGAFNVAGTQVPARVANARSAGIKDLRFGYLLDEDWQGKDPDALLENRRTELPPLEGVTYIFIATTVSGDADDSLGHLIGDVMVRQQSAKGPVAFETSFDVHAQVVSGVVHFEIQSHPAVYERLASVLAGGGRSES